MKTDAATACLDRRRALQALKAAVVEGTVWRYEHVVEAAQDAGATDEEIDRTAHEALEALFAAAERPLTARQLAHFPLAEQSCA